jgi:hypothetical protein
LNTIEVKFESALHLAVAVVVVIGFVVFTTFQINMQPKADALAFFPMTVLLAIYFFKTLYIALSKRAVFGPDSISLQTYFGNFEIRTDKIEYIVQGFGNMKIGNSGQALSVPDVAYWNHSASKEFSEFYVKHLALRGIIPRNGFGAFWPQYKNCRIGYPVLSWNRSRSCGTHSQQYQEPPCVLF